MKPREPGSLYSSMLPGLLPCPHIQPAWEKVEVQGGEDVLSCRCLGICSSLPFPVHWWELSHVQDWEMRSLAVQLYVHREGGTHLKGFWVKLWVLFSVVHFLFLLYRFPSFHILSLLGFSEGLALDLINLWIILSLMKQLQFAFAWDTSLVLEEAFWSQPLCSGGLESWRISYLIVSPFVKWE